MELARLAMRHFLCQSGSGLVIVAHCVAWQRSLYRKLDFAGKIARQISMLRRFVPAEMFDKSLRKQMRLPPELKSAPIPPSACEFKLRSPILISGLQRSLKVLTPLQWAAVFIVAKARRKASEPDGACPLLGLPKQLADPDDSGCGDPAKGHQRSFSIVMGFRRSISLPRYQRRPIWA